ncbi:tetratricopeptide repeat protein [Bythopirellula goksoeyrii]|nr:hypothetical protein [Bythopirellula goksoeyrii]
MQVLNALSLMTALLLGFGLLPTQFGSANDVLGEQIKVVYLDVFRPSKVEKEWTPLLPRELIRQAVLLSAREEFGFTTRDMVLGDSIDESNPHIDSLKCSTVTADQKMSLTLQLSEDPENKHSLSHKIQAAAGGYVSSKSYPDIVEKSELWTRSELVELFKSWGWIHKPTPINPEATLSEEVESLLHTFNEYAQFDAVRRLHSQIRTEGESPALLAALVRGYANLGQLCRYHFTGREQVFYARSLLYAERLLVRHGDSPFARWNRAYARVMAGLDFAAVKDLQQAEEFLNSDTPPAWVPILTAYLDHSLIKSVNKTNSEDSSIEQENLSDQAPEEPEAPEWVQIAFDLFGSRAELNNQEPADPTDSLAAYLCLVLAERTRNVSYQNTFFDSLIRLQPLCLRAIDSMADRGGVSNLHRMTTLGPSVNLRSLRSHVLAMPGLPPEAVSTIRECYEGNWPNKPVPSLVMALRAGMADDLESELSWSALAEMIQDVHFVQVYRRGIFMKFSWSVPVDDFLDAASQSLQGYRFAPIIEALHLDPTLQSNEINALMEKIQFGDLSVTATLLLDKSWWGRKPTTTSHFRWVWNRLIQSGDATSHDLVARIVKLHTHQNSRRLWFARELHFVNPYSPIWASAFVSNDWVHAQPDVKRYLEHFGYDPYFLRRLAEQQVKAELYEDAQKTLERFIVVCPNRWGYEELAAIHRRKGENTIANTLMEEFLSVGTDLGLSDARVHAELAEKHLEQNEFDEALKHAELAAQSGAAWAMMTAAYVNERTGHWNRSESLVRSTSERYDTGRSLLYWWCRRTGRGDLEYARGLAQQYFTEPHDTSCISGEIDEALFSLLEDNPEAALKSLLHKFEPDKDPFIGLHAVLVANQLDQLETRDSLLQDLPVEWIPASVGSHQRYYELANLLRKFWNGEEVVFDWKVFDEKVKRLSKIHQVRVYYFVSEVGKILGTQKLADEYLKRCTAPIGGVDDANQILALAQLHAKGEDPYAEDLPELHQVPWPGSDSELYQMAGRLIDQGRPAEAKPLLLEFVERTGNYTGMRRLARLHLQNHEFLEALPFAERAATWGDSTGIFRAMSANDGLGRFDDSEKWVRKLAERYEDDQAEWYLWCIRTGQGDVANARVLAKKHYVDADPPYKAGDWRSPVFFLLDEDIPEAIREFQSAYEHYPDPWSGLHLATLYEAIGNDEQRNDILESVANTKHLKRFGKSDRNSMVKLAQLFLPACLDPTNTHPISQQIDYLSSTLSTNQKVNVNYFAAHLFQTIGDDSLALEYLKRCVTPNYSLQVNQSLAYRDLRKSGLDPFDLLTSKEEAIDTDR